MKDQAENIFLDAQGLEPAERRAFLDHVCRDEHPLRQRVEAMLASFDEAERFFETDAPTIPSGPPRIGLSAEVPTEREGGRIGRYKLLQKIGEGGFGTVWMAEQTEPMTRRVALKVIKMGMDTQEVVARFEAERQALAMMEHPNIAKVLDAGATPRGRPFFVMELVKGVPVTEYCDGKKLGVRERLELFIDICGAVGHAHQKGIIHRDLKPSNILVTMHGDRPVPKVIDFGIAKATQSRLTDKTLFTRFEQFVGTPVYMSPEQTAISGLDIDTRSDIYSLGVLLYELLAGRPPFDARSLISAGYDEMRRIIREQEPPKPSTSIGTLEGAEGNRLADTHKTDLQRLHRLVKGDLDWIVMKAIEKDRGRRYETANGLIEDIRRHLNCEPVSAGPPNASYRLRKFVRRNRSALGVAAMLAAMLLAGSAVSTWQALRATQARDRLADQVLATESERLRAEENFLLAREAVDRYLHRVANDPRLARGLLPLREQLLGDALAYYERFLDSGRTDDKLGAATVHAASQVALIQNLIGAKDRSLHSYERVIALLERSEQPRQASVLRELASCHHAVGLIYIDLDRYDEAEASIAKALAIRSELHRADPDDDVLAATLASDYNALGIVRTKSYYSEQALAPLDSAVGLLEKLIAEDPDNATYVSQMGAVKNSQSDVRRLLGDRDASERLLSEAVAHQETAVKLSPENLGYREFLANHLFNLGITMAERHDSTSGDILDRARRERDTLVQAEPSVARWQLDLARTYIELGTLPDAAFTEGAADSQRMFEQAIAILQRLVGVTPDWNDARSQLAQACHQLAKLHLASDRNGPALPLWQEAAQHSRDLAAKDPLNAATHRSNLARSLYYVGYLLEQSGRSSEALESLTRCRAEYERLSAEGARVQEHLYMLSRCYNSQGLVFAAMGRAEDAEEAYGKGLETCRSLQDSGQGGVANLIMLGGIGCNQGHLMAARGSFDQAARCYRQADEALRGALAIEPKNPTAIAYWYHTASGLIDVLERAGRIWEALEYCKGLQGHVPEEYAPTFKLRLAYFAARAREHALSSKTIDALGDPEFDDSAVLNIAGIHAINAATVAADDAELCKRYQEESLRWLRKRLARGHVDRHEIEANEDFASLHGLKAFQALFSEVPR